MPPAPVRRWASGRIALFLVLALGLSGGCGGGDDLRERDVPVRVGSVGMDPVTESPVVVLREREGDRSLPIWIGMTEARAIATEMEELQPRRPNTHDLAKRLIAGLEARFDRAVVTRLEEGTYYAVIFLSDGGRHIEIDARPSDAIAIALRLDAPLFVREPLFEPPGAHQLEDAALNESEGVRL